MTVERIFIYLKSYFRGKTVFKQYINLNNAFCVILNLTLSQQDASTLELGKQIFLIALKSKTV